MLRKMFFVATATLAAASILSFSENASAHGFSADDDYDDNYYCDDDYCKPPKDSVKIVGVTYGGTGCKDGTVGVHLSQDYESLTMMYDEYIAQVGPGIANQEKRKFCHIVMELDHPAGFSYALVKLTYKGYVDLDDGVKAEQKSTYYFQGFKRDTVSFRTKFPSGFIGDFEYRDDVESIAWSPCDKKRGLNVVTSVQIDNKSRDKYAEGMISIDSIDVDVAKSGVFETYDLLWRKCK